MAQREIHVGGHEMRDHDEKRMRCRNDFMCKNSKEGASIHAPHQVVKLNGRQYHMSDPSCFSHFLSSQWLHVCFSWTQYLHTPVTSFLQAPLSRQRAGLISNQRFDKDLALSTSPFTCPAHNDHHQSTPSHGAPLGESW